MERVTIWYCTDNEHGVALAETIGRLGVAVNTISSAQLAEANLNEAAINIFVFDLVHQRGKALLVDIGKDDRIKVCVKFLILTRKEVTQLSRLSFNLFHLEFIHRPVNRGEFLLLLEKTILVERYREIMRSISRESEARIETFEGLMDINRKNAFALESEKETFKKIIMFEKGLQSEQVRLHKAIRDFSLLRQEQIYDLKKRISAEESLDLLRERELMNAHEVIGAQEKVIDFSARQLEETKEILDASSSVAELSRAEALALHDQLRRERELNRNLSDEVDRLLGEIKSLRASGS